MTTITKPARIADKTPITSDAEMLLRDAAFVLRLTRKVKAEILAERPQTARVAASRSHEMASGLGV
jgi:hypothetical protein